MESDARVRIWEEQVAIPTYPVGKPEKSPLFLEKRAYQGSTGKVYPLPVTEEISDEKTDVAYRAVFLENEYLKVMVLPELGGRIQRAYDKTNDYDFVYYNHVIRPALVGLAGPWISGGIEFNWPQHHRPSTFAPVDYTIEEREDGACSVYLSEMDRMYGTKGMAVISLYPGKAYIEIRGQLYNGTDLPQTFLWWANPAVPVNDDTYSVFPPDVNAVMDHGKRAVSTFPIATGEYYKYDYSAGVDISRYKNVKVPTSYMAAHSDYDFIGNYDEGREAGLLHVADHHIAPGKKQWTWGNGDFGRMWDRNLTETDGPYIELMTGVFTDNQPDFTWLKPQEEKNFVQYFMPYKGVGRVTNATKDCAIGLFRENGDAGSGIGGLPVKSDDAGNGIGGLSVKSDDAGSDIDESSGKDCEAGSNATASLKANDISPMEIRVYATGAYPDAEVAVYYKEKKVFSRRADLTPEACFACEFPAPGRDEDYRATVCWRGRTLVEVSLYRAEPAPIPEPARPIPEPAEVATLEELYLAATHLEQYRHATREPADYYEEGLRRDPTDIRLNNGYGLLLLRRGKARMSIPYFQAAIAKQTTKNPNPYSGECYFNLGLALDAVGREQEAYDAFYKATWSGETQSAAFFWLGNLAARRGDYEAALDFVEKSLIRNWHNEKGRMLKAALLRKLGRPSKHFLEESLAIDPLYMGCLYEMALCEENGTACEETGACCETRAAVCEQGATECANNVAACACEQATHEEKRGKTFWKEKMRGEVHNYLELSLDYGKAGFYEEALDILKACPQKSPLCLYYQGFVHGKMAARKEACRDISGKERQEVWKQRDLPEEGAELWKARQCCMEAELADSYCCFPNRTEEIAILEYAISLLENAPMAHYYLGNLFYDKKQYEDAIRHWEISAGEKKDFALTHRNLSIAYYNKKKDIANARREMEQALALDGTYPRMWLEYDQLAARAGLTVEERLQAMEAHPDVVVKRDDLYLRWVTLLNCAGRYGEALAAILARQFHPWEGGEGKVSAQYRFSLIQLAVQCLAKKRPKKALDYLQNSLQYPISLGEGKLPNVPDNEAHYYMGLAYRMLGEEDKASHCFLLACGGKSEPEPVLYYNDQPSDYIFYQGLAHRALGEEEAARKAFQALTHYGETHLPDQVEYDFFAVSLPEIEVYQEDIGKRNRLYCKYLIALGSVGLGEKGKGRALLGQILEEQADYQGALQVRRILSIIS